MGVFSRHAAAGAQSLAAVPGQGSIVDQVSRFLDRDGDGSIANDMSGLMRSMLDRSSK